MCYNLLYYYPASLNVHKCLSAPTLGDWNTFLTNLRSINYLTVPGTLSSSQANSSTNILSMISPVNAYLRQKFQDFYYYTSHVQTCSIGGSAAAISTVSSLSLYINIFNFKFKMSHLVPYYSIYLSLLYREFINRVNICANNAIILFK